MNKIILNLMLIIVGTLVFTFRKQLIKYYEKRDTQSKQPALQEIREMRIIITSLFIIMMGIVGLIV